MKATLPTLLFVSDRTDDLFDLHRRLEGSAVLVYAASAAGFDRTARRALWRETDSLVIDFRTQPRSMRERIAKCVNATTPPCRVLMIHSKVRPPMREAGDARVVPVEFDIPASGLAAAVHFGLGRHDILIRALLAVVPSLSPLGRRFVTEVLSGRFQHVRVGDIASILGLHRSQLHHRLVADGDPNPRQLIDICYAATMAVLLSNGQGRIVDAASFARNPDPRVPRDAIRRVSGMTFRGLRIVARREGGVAVASRLVRNFQQLSLCPSR